MLLLLSFFSYMYLFASLTYVSPFSGKRPANGFEARPDIRPLIPEHFSREEAVLAGSVQSGGRLDGAVYRADPNEPFGSWMLMFASLSAFVGTFVIAQRRKIITDSAPRRQGASARAKSAVPSNESP